jgi:hypothetical protein
VFESLSVVACCCVVGRNSLLATCQLACRLSSCVVLRLSKGCCCLQQLGRTNTCLQMSYSAPTGSGAVAAARSHAYAPKL